ncbi:Kin of IRRE-like protein 2 [Taenia solium]|eukprot:TsM_000894500 transcript=TsM_000894500 gene=TsM_000894500
MSLTFICDGGYDRELRNWPKYSMQGDADKGEHDLVISSVSREDAGNFECQVSPTANQPLLRRSTNLSVLVVPSKPIIMAPPGEPQPTKNGQLVISRPGFSAESNPNDLSSTDDKLRLICQAKGGVPAPDFEWFHNGLPMRVSYVEGGGGGGNEVSPTATAGGEAEGEAVLVIPKADLITGDRLTCLVSNKATQRAANLGQQKLLAEVIVTVQTPPGAPVILSSEGNIVDSMITNEGDTVNLMCQSKPPGSPPGELVWRWDQPPSPFQAESSASLSPLTPTATELNKLPNLEQFSRHTLDRNQLETHLSLPGVKRAQNGLSIACVTRHKLGMEQKAKILLNTFIAEMFGKKAGSQSTSRLIRGWTQLSHLPISHHDAAVAKKIDDISHSVSRHPNRARRHDTR